jgi:hypothetical protein
LTAAGPDGGAGPRPGRHRRRSSRPVRRLPVLVAIPAVLVVGLVVDVTASNSSSVPDVSSVQPAPEAPPLAALSSSWFCAGAADSETASLPDAPAGTVYVYNDTGSPEQATVTVVSTAGPDAVHRAIVAPGATVAVPEAVPGGSAWTGAVVDTDGSAAVEQVLEGPLGRSVGPCATSGSPDWYFPSGQTRVNASETLLLMDPYATASVVDLSFTTDQGQEQPQGFEGIPVAPGQLVAVNLGAHLRRRASIATTVAARAGRVVAWTEEVVTPPQAGQPLVGTPAASSPLADPAFPIPGVALTLGAPSLGTRWVWPDGLAGNGVDEEYLIYNPGAETAEVSLSIGLAVGSSEPFRLPVGPGQLVPVVSEQQARIPAGSPHSAVLVSLNGVPVAAMRTAASAAPVQAPTAGLVAGSGLGVMPGCPDPSLQWMVPWSATGPHHQGRMTVYDPGPGPAQVTFEVGHQPPYTESISPGTRISLAVDPPSPGPVVLRSSAEVYAEYDLSGSAPGGGYSIAPAIPLG